MIPGLSGAGDAASGFLKDHGGQIVQGLAGIDAARQQGQARDTQNKAMQYATGSYDSRAPLRAAGQAGMLNPQAPAALRALNTGSKGNAYGKGALPSVSSPVPSIAPVSSVMGQSASPAQASAAMAAFQQTPGGVWSKLKAVQGAS